MDEIDRRIIDDMKSELVLRKREGEHLSEKLDCLILLIRRAWQGDKEAVDQISEIVGIPPPSIIPPSKEEQETNGELGHEYLKLTSALLDEQLAEDENIKKSTKVLRPASSKKRVSRRPVSAAVSSNSRGPSNMMSNSSLRPVTKDPSPTPSPRNRLATQTLQLPIEIRMKLPPPNLPMTNLQDIMPLFSHSDKRNEVSSKKGQEDQEKQNETKTTKFEDDRQKLFQPNGLIREKKTRPVSAALQNRQDYLRSQGKKKKPRPKSAMPIGKPAFRHSTDSEYDFLVRTHHGQPSPEPISPTNRGTSSPVRMSAEGAPLSVSVLQKPPGERRRTAPHPRNFPCERDNQPFGDVHDALQRVQEMERLFRQNTRKLQKKIGIPSAGCI